ncbi:exopolysaccharide biosynthesis flippase VpsE [Vibrio anguillarum]|uniref:exopolysaccharide biosynthesis flippase VpsE n=1 Tax=Vibrio anguillarum TaxID=55601 RepID=UPI0002FD5E1B|nr:exopolysaccharide biosynthesis flippase VpsE [Vibrio anguillarum]OEE38055.1 sugar transporter [Vibrio anguillarum]OEF89081.1 sugar transporter [Vibrio anguillarum]
MIASLLRYAPVQVFAALSVFMLIAVQTRFLTPENYGVLAVAMVVLELVRAFSTQWLNTSMLRLYPGYSDREQVQLVQTISLLVIIGSLLGFIVIAATLFIYQQLNWERLLILGALLSVKSIFQYQLELSRLNERLSAYRQATVLQSISAVVLSILSLSWAATIESALFALTLSFGIGALGLGFPRRPEWHIATLKRLLTYGIPIMLAGGIGVLGGRVDRLFIAHFVGMNETGIYAAQANLLMGVLGLVFMVIAMPLYPNLAKHAEDKITLVSQHKTYLHLLVTLTFPALLGLGILQEEIIRLFLGEQYLSSSTELFWVLAIAVYLINFKCHYLDHGLQFLSQTRKLLWVSLSGLVASIFLLPFMLNQFGMFGAAITLLIVSGLVAILSFISSWRSGYRYAIGIDSIKVIISALLMGGYLYAVKQCPLAIHSLFALAFYVTSSLLFYGICLWCTNAFNARQRLFSIWRPN